MDRRFHKIRWRLDLHAERRLTCNRMPSEVTMPGENAWATTTPKMPNPEKKYFTLAEANRALPYVARVVVDIARVYARVVELRQELERPGPRRPTHENLEARYETAMDQLSELVDEINNVGAELKDFEKGLVDFPALHEGREVLLCWQRDEAEITHWHEVDAGYAGRRPVRELGPSPAEPHR